MTNGDFDHFRDRFIKETERGVGELLAALEANMHTGLRESGRGRQDERLRAYIKLISRPREE